MILGKYNQSKTVTFDLVAPDGVDLITNATFAAGDVVIMKDEGAEANTTNLPTDEGTGYSLVLTATEMSAARIRVYIIDQTATKIWLDISLGLETYGNASAEHAFDLDTASTAQTADHTAGIADIPTVAEFNARTLLAADYFDPAVDAVATVTTLTNLPAITANWLTAAGIAASALDGKGDWNTVVPPTVAQLDARTLLAANYFDPAVDAVATVTNLTNLPAITANWLTAAGIAASALDGKGDWNIGKTSYSLTQAFPTNFSSLVIDGSGRADSFVQGFLNTAIAETTAGNVANNFDTFYDNANALTTQVVDDVGAGAGGSTDWTASERNELRGRLGITGTTAAGGNTPTLSTQASVDTVDGIVDNILVDTNDLQTNQSDWLTATGFSTFDAAVDTVNASVIEWKGLTPVVDAIEDQYDGTTGLSGETYPASQAQVSNIGASSGSAINYAPVGDNTGGALKGVTFVGSQTNLYTDTRTVNGTKHEILHATNVIDIVYQFNLGSISTPVELEFVGLLNSSNDDCIISVYSYDLAAFEQVGTIAGQNDGTLNITENMRLLPDHASDGAVDNVGDVFMRIQTTGSPTSPTLKTDALFLSAVAKTGTLGFEMASVWVDTVNGIAGTADGTGTASNPVDNIADARTIADDGANNIKVFHPVAGSNFTLAQNFDGYSFKQAERGFRIDLGSQSVSNVYIMRGNVFGNDSGTNAVGTIYESCKMNTNTLGDHATIDCVYGGTTTCAEATTTYSITRPRVDDADRAVTMDINSLADVGISVIGMSNDFTFLNAVATSFINISGSGGVITIDATCTGGTLNVFGNFTIVDNASGAVTVNDDARFTIQQVRSEIDTNSTQLAAIVLDTGTTLPGDIAALPTHAEINAEVVDVMEIDTHAQPATVLSATASYQDILTWTGTVHRNKLTQTNTTTSLRNDGDTADIATSAVSDDGTTFTRGKYV